MNSLPSARRIEASRHVDQNHISIASDVADLRAMCNWAIQAREECGPGWLDKIPVTKKVTKLIGNAKAVKRPINPRWFDIAAATIENKRDRAWFDVTRYLGRLKDESIV